MSTHKDEKNGTWYMMVPSLTRVLENKNQE